MNGVRKAAVLLQSLDQNLAARILALLPSDQVDRATQAVAIAESPRAEELSSVLIEFRTQLQSKPVLQRGAFPAAREQLEERHSEVSQVQVQAHSIEPDATARHVANLRQDVTNLMAQNPFGFLQDRHPDDIRQLLNDEQPQTIAVIAVQLTPAISAAVLAGLPPDRQADILQRVARLGPTDPEILADIAAVLRERIGRPRDHAGGVPQAAAVLRESSRAATRTILTTLDECDSELADELRQTLFSFDDLLKLDDDTLRVILQETDDRQWALALKASPVAVRQKVLGCLPTRVAAAFQVEMDSLGPVRLSEMTTVRQQIADNIRRLEDAGLIILPVN